MQRGVLLVDDQPEFLRAAERILLGHPDIAVLGTATSGEEALGLVPLLGPDVVILDVQMPGMGGFETARRLRSVAPQVRVLLISADNEPEYELFARAAGAELFRTKKAFLGDPTAGILSPI